MKPEDNTQNENERQPVEAALSSDPPRGRVLYLGGGTRTKPSPGHAYVTVEMPKADIGRVQLYSIVEIRTADAASPSRGDPLRDMLADACGGAIESNHASDAWDLPRYCEHIRDRQVAIVELLFELLPDQAEHLGQPYGDSFDAVEAALRHLEMRDAILDRLVIAGYVTETLCDELEDAINRERHPEVTP